MYSYTYINDTFVYFRRRLHHPTPETGTDQNTHVHLPQDQASSRDNLSEESDPAIHLRESSAEASDKNVATLKGANGVGSSDVMPTGNYTSGPAYQKLHGANQVYPSEPVCEGDDRNLALADKKSGEDISTRYVQGQKYKYLV